MLRPFYLFVQAAEESGKKVQELEGVSDCPTLDRASLACASTIEANKHPSPEGTRKNEVRSLDK